MNLMISTHKMITPYIIEIMFEEFKRKFGMKPIKELDWSNEFDGTSEIQIFRDNKPYLYNVDLKKKYLSFMLKEDLYVAHKSLFFKSDHSAEILDWLGEYTFVVTNDSENISKENVINYSKLKKLDISEYSYYTLGTYYQPSELEISEWTKLGFLQKLTA